MTAYAQGTTTRISKSIEEIQSTVRRYGGTGFSHALVEDQGGRIVFQIRGYWLRFKVEYPDFASMNYYITPSGRGRYRTKPQMIAAYEAECKRVWRVALLQIKTTLEIGKELSDEAFYENVAGRVLLSTGETLAESAKEGLSGMMYSQDGATKLLKG